MKHYQVLGHTADIRLKVEASTLTELFKVAIDGMNHILKSQKVSGEISGKMIIEVQSPDITALLVDFMNEVLYRSQANKEIYMDVKFLEFSDVALKTEIGGQKVEEFDEDIKAVTYHEAEIIKNEKGNYETVIVFDI